MSQCLHIGQALSRLPLAIRKKGRKNLLSWPMRCMTSNGATSFNLNNPSDIISSVRAFLSVFLFFVAWPIFCHRDKNLVTMTKIWSRWQLELSRDQFFDIVTKIWSRWQKFGHDDNWNCRVTNFSSSWQKFGFETLIKSRWSSTRTLVHWSNPHHHQVCLDIDKIPINIHQGRLDMNEIPIIIIKDAWAWMKFICMSSGILNCLNTGLFKVINF